MLSEVPEAPYGLKVLDKSGRTVQLSWAAPYDGNSPIKKFLIEYKRAKGNWEKDIDRYLLHIKDFLKCDVAASTGLRVKPAGRIPV